MTRSRPLSVAYLLDDTVMFGGVKVVLRQADLLTELGHDARVVSRGPRPDWYALRAPFERVDRFTRDTIPPSDVTVATYWTTIGPAREAAHREVAHYCQGFEASYTHNLADHPAIVEAYAVPVPALVVSPHLGELLAQRFARPSRVVLQPLETFWRPDLRARLRRRPARPARILVPGPWEGDWKGVPTGLQAVAELRRRGVACRLVRLSQYPLRRDEESLLAPDEYHHHLPPREAARVVAGCDLMIAPSWEQEGFGLPVLEAFAAGVPVVASDISSFRGFASPAAHLAPAQDARAFADGAEALLTDALRWRRQRRRGFAVAARYTPRRAARSAVEALRWVASGEWRSQAARAG
jgi:glycosyltransferase involved in cell wall biosynthesis